MSNFFGGRRSLRYKLGCGIGFFLIFRDMPTFTAIAFDRLIEPRESKFVDMPVPNLPPLKSKPVPHPNSKLERRNSASVVNERKVNRPQITPALYATPEATPLPDSPSSFPPSPYIVNHKRRGPRLVKSFSVADVASRQKAIDEGKVNGTATQSAKTKDAVLTKSASVTFAIPDPIEEEHENNVHNSPLAKDQMNGLNKGSVEMGHANGVYDDDLGSSNRELGSSNMALGSSNVSNGLAGKKDLLKSATFKSESESEDFFDPHESLSYTSNTDGEDNTGAESSVRNATPMGEFYDAWDELSSESGPQSSPSDIEAELRGMRMSLHMEIEKRKQAEAALNDMQSQWQRVRHQLDHVGLRLPETLTVVVEGQQSDSDPAEELCRQVYLARFVSESVGRGIAKAEMEAEMESQIESKNFEIARLCDRLHYYEAMNQEMSQRNQEAVEMARRDRQIRKRRQKWVWGSIATAITLGTAALAWSYLPTGTGSSSSSAPRASEHNDAAKE
ncbi:hypothetical protein Q3G72_010687 [Acer saccharum]|nr:hypothetical protein Q3G72_010687 [Acer saccharum]